MFFFYQTYPNASSLLMPKQPKYKLFLSSQTKMGKCTTL